MSIETHTMVWSGITLQLRYEAKAFGGVIAHLQVEAIEPVRAPLPITDTGYKSHYHPVGTVKSTLGTLVEQVTAWLDQEAAKSAWQEYLRDSRQLSLF